jgi:hypothetical protein
MSTHHAEMKLLMGRCRDCDHDLKVLRHGANSGHVRCSNRSCRWHLVNYRMGKGINEGPVAA